MLSTNILLLLLCLSLAGALPLAQQNDDDQVSEKREASSGGSGDSGGLVLGVARDDTELADSGGNLVKRESDDTTRALEERGASIGGLGLEQTDSSGNLVKREGGILENKLEISKRRRNRCRRAGCRKPKPKPKPQRNPKKCGLTCKVTKFGSKITMDDIVGASEIISHVGSAVHDIASAFKPSYPYEYGGNEPFEEENEPFE